MPPSSSSDARLLHVDRPNRLASAPAEAKDRRRPPITADPRQVEAAPVCRRRSFVRLRAKLRNRRSAGLSLCGSHAALNWSSSSFPAIGRNITFGKGVATVASVVRLMPNPMATKCIKCVAANIEILNDAAMSIDQPPVEPVAESAVVFRLACNEMLTAKIAPFDLFPFTQCVMLPEHNKYSFAPKRKSFATVGISSCR